ncbi:MAG: alpha/beta fold hydrolase [Acidobacteriota bacterium]|nr:alpha/beta fold hydrolase [Acidobacteriota bacterium]
MTPASARFKGHFDLIGKGAPILALSGLGCSNWIFEDLAARLRDLGQWIMPDNRGMGLSPKADTPYEITDLARDALALMDGLGHDRFAVVGISMGGFIAQTIAHMVPERVTRLVLMCTTGPGPDFIPLPDFPSELIRTSYSMDPVIMTRSNTDSTTHPSLKIRQPQRYRQIFEKKLANISDMEQLLIQNEAAVRFTREYHIDYSRITCPTLAMAGAEDRFVPPDNTRLLARKTASGEAVLIPESDHLFFLEKPESVALALRRFLEAL